ncbi:hypothetical protein NQZ68_002463 [Dissostichus eleginoides]|nr:hypothetical protein NQZ68_002463 [Dissostichus eleginoides]
MFDRRAFRHGGAESPGVVVRVWQRVYCCVNATTACRSKTQRGLRWRNGKSPQLCSMFPAPPEIIQRWYVSACSSSSPKYETVQRPGRELSDIRGPPGQAGLEPALLLQLWLVVRQTEHTQRAAAPVNIRDRRVLETAACYPSFTQGNIKLN